MRQLSVLHVYRMYYPDFPGGGQEAIRQIAISTKPFGVSSSIFTLSVRPVPHRIQLGEGLVHRSRSWWAPASCDLGGINAFRTFSQLANKVDLIHYHFPWPFADLLHFFGRPRAPAIMTYHSDIVRQRTLGRLYAPLMRQMLRQMKAVVATSPEYAATSHTLSTPELRSKLHVIPLGIEDCLASGALDRSLLRRLGLCEAGPFFLFLGVLRYYKGLHTLIQASKSVNVPIVIAGVGPEEGRLKDQVHRLGLKNVFFAGQVSNSEKAVLIRYCRAVVLPSHLRSEAFGMVLVEASMHGKPMITCEIGTGTTFVNVDSETGYVVPPENASLLGNAMNKLAQDQNLAAEFGFRARQRYESHFSSLAMGRAYESLYREVLLGCRVPSAASEVI